MGLSLQRDLNDVLVFMEVVSAGSFTAAGRELGVPTSTVSRRVSRLEEALGIKLLQRTTRALSLTEAGQLYYERSKTLFAGLEDTENEIADARQSPKGRVRVTAPLEHSVSMQLVGPFMERYPDVRVDLHLTNNDVNILAEGYDVAISAGPLTNLSVVAHKLMDSPFRVVASSDYLAGRDTPQHPRDLSEHDCILFGPSSSGGMWSFAEGEDTLQVPVRGRIAVNHMGAVREAAIAGMGVALLPALICASDVRSGALTVLELGAASPPVPVWITHAAGRFLPPAVRAFVDHVKAHFTEAADETLEA
jgi:DNA-binding transcriptional LysR family regulator